MNTSSLAGLPLLLFTNVLHAQPATSLAGGVEDPPPEHTVPAAAPAASFWPWTLELPKEHPGWGEGPAKSYLIPALEIVGFEFLLNQFNRHFNSEDVYRTDFSTIKENLSRGWIIDSDPFATNQFMHPYQGSIYHGFGRSAGLTYWEALGYDFAGSALWEVAGETGSPSLNDQITTSFGGSFLGEALFRMANYYLETGDQSPGFFRELGATLIAPSAGFNRIVYGGRFDAIYPSHDPAVYTRAGIGWRHNQKPDHADAPEQATTDEAVADFVMDYGLPGKAGYEYTRPFDYFHFEATLATSSNAAPEDITIRGLLWGERYSWGDNYRGVWGLYGGYDYISPEIFSVSSTSASLGTTAQWWVSDSVALQGTLLAGAGWTASGTIADAETDRDYHYGVSPMSLGALRIILGTTAVLDMTGRYYYIGGLGSGAREDSETILRGKIALTLRIFKQHGIGIQYVASSRDAYFSDLPDTSQSIAAVSLFYTYIGDTHFGAVDWR